MCLPAENLLLSKSFKNLGGPGRRRRGECLCAVWILQTWLPVCNSVALGGFCNACIAMMTSRICDFKQLHLYCVTTAQFIGPQFGQCCVNELSDNARVWRWLYEEYATNTHNPWCLTQCMSVGMVDLVDCIMASCHHCHSIHTTLRKLTLRERFQKYRLLSRSPSHTHFSTLSPIHPSTTRHLTQSVWLLHTHSDPSN